MSNPSDPTLDLWKLFIFWFVGVTMVGVGVSDNYMFSSDS